MKWFKKNNKLECDDISNDEYYEVKIKEFDEVFYCDDYKVSLPLYRDKGEEKMYFLYMKDRCFVAFAENRIERLEKVNKYNCCCHCCNRRQCEYRIRII